MIARIGSKHPRRMFLKEWRVKRGLTQEQLADRIDTHKAQISNWENGNRNPGYAAQVALSEALDLDGPNALFWHPDRPSADDLLRNAPPAVVDEAIEIIKVLVNRKAS